MRSSATVVLLCATVAVSAQTRDLLPLWEIGAVGFGLSQQAYPGADEHVQRGLLLPYVIYRGRFVRADREGVGLRPIKTPRFELDISAAGTFGSGADDVEARRGMPDLGTLVEFGPRLKWNLAGTPQQGRLRLELPLRGVFDLDDRLAHRGMVFQPALTWHTREAADWRWSASLSALVADRRLARTFYEVEPRFATVGRPAYRAEAGLMAWRVSVVAQRELTPDWRVFGYARVDSVAGAANRASPLVRRTTGATAGIGATYTWRRSAAPARE